MQTTAIVCTHVSGTVLASSSSTHSSTTAASRVAAPTRLEVQNMKKGGGGAYLWRALMTFAVTVGLNCYGVFAVWLNFLILLSTFYLLCYIYIDVLGRRVDEYIG